MLTRNCVVCKKDAKKFCGKCKQEWYCSRECQVISWKTHKSECEKMAEKFKRPNLPKSKQFDGSNLVGFGKEDNVAIWASLSGENVEQNGSKNLLGFKFLILNENEGNARVVSKTLLLTVKGQSLRRKVAAGNGKEVKFVDGTGKGEGYSADKADLEKGQFGVTLGSFEVDGNDVSKALDSLDFVEVPVKIDGKGVVTIKVVLEKQPEQQKQQEVKKADPSLNPKEMD